MEDSVQGTFKVVVLGEGKLFACHSMLKPVVVMLTMRYSLQQE